MQRVVALLCKIDMIEVTYERTLVQWYVDFRSLDSRFLVLIFYRIEIPVKRLCIETAEEIHEDSCGMKSLGETPESVSSEEAHQCTRKA